MLQSMTVARMVGYKVLEPFGPGFGLSGAACPGEAVITFASSLLAHAVLH